MVMLKDNLKKNSSLTYQRLVFLRLSHNCWRIFRKDTFLNIEEVGKWKYLFKCVLCNIPSSCSAICPVLLHYHPPSTHASWNLKSLQAGEPQAHLFESTTAFTSFSLWDLQSATLKWHREYIHRYNSFPVQTTHTHTSTDGQLPSLRWLSLLVPTLARSAGKDASSNPSRHNCL